MAQTAPSTSLLFITHHAEFPLRINNCRDGEGRQSAGAEGQVGVDQSPHLSVALGDSAGVEAGPEEPEEDGAHHREEVAGPVGAGLRALGGLLDVENPRGRQAEVGSEHVDEDGVSGVSGPHVGTTNDLVDVEEDDLNHGHNNQLDRSGGSEEDSEGDENSSGGELSVEKADQGDVNPGPVRVAAVAGGNVSLLAVTTTTSGSRRGRQC